MDFFLEMKHCLGDVAIWCFLIQSVQLGKLKLTRISFLGSHTFWQAPKCTCKVRRLFVCFFFQRGAVTFSASRQLPVLYLLLTLMVASERRQRGKVTFSSPENFKENSSRQYLWWTIQLPFAHGNPGRKTLSSSTCPYALFPLSR